MLELEIELAYCADGPAPAPAAASAPALAPVSGPVPAPAPGPSADPSAQAGAPAPSLATLRGRRLLSEASDAHTAGVQLTQHLRRYLLQPTEQDPEALLHHLQRHLLVCFEASSCAVHWELQLQNSS